MYRPLGVFLLLGPTLLAQAPGSRNVSVTPAIFGGLQWRFIGPAATGGRIADLAITRSPGQPAVMYVATTTGGVFKSLNEGVSWTPIFDYSGGMMSIGAIAVAPSQPDVVWVGTGEADNRQSSSWGDGVYKSVNGGLGWQKMGLADTRHIGKILVHPTDPNTVWVAAVGHLWGPNAERGIFKTTDGGATWKKVLFKDENTGAIDMAMDPRDPNVLFAALYQRQRKGWGFNGGGPGGGIYRSTDGGNTWTELKNGLPTGDKGRIGLTTFPGDSRLVYAIVEADPASASGVYRSTDRGETWQHLSALNPRPSYYSRIYLDPRDANRVYIMGSNRGFYISDDGGRSFQDVFTNVHSEDHTMWVDPDNTNHLVIGGDGGVSISFDRGRTWLFRMNLPLGQYYNISVNNADPYLVCGGLQDNGSWCTPSASNTAYGVSFKDAFNIGFGDGMQTVFEGDDHTVLVSSQNGVTARLDLRNMQRQTLGPVQAPQRPQPNYRWYWTTPLMVSSFDANTIYTGANVLFRSTDRGVSWKAISPDLTANVNRDLLQMMGGPVTARTLSRHDGQSNFSTLTVIAESPLDRNLLYTGADDGSLQMTRDGGQHWTNLTASVSGLPAGLNISGIVASRYAAGRVYLTVDGHFNDDYRPFVFVSEDYGKTWRSIVTGLPLTSVHRLREHPSNPNLLVAGLETGVYGSFDRGGNWITLNGNMPPVPVYDLLWHPRDGALVLGTHGRSIWILDHAEPLSQITPEILNGSGHLFPIPPAAPQLIYSGQYWFGAGEFFAPNPPAGAVLTYYLPTSVNTVEITVSDSTGKAIRTLRGPANAGINRTCWDLRMGPPMPSGFAPMGNCAFNSFGRTGPQVLPGKYTVNVTTTGGPPLTAPVTVLADPRFPITDADRRTRSAAVMSAYGLRQQLAAARDAVQTISNQVMNTRIAFGGGNESTRGAMGALENAAAKFGPVQNQLMRALAAALSVETAMDEYAGLPTAAQLRELDWAWEDAAAAVTALNRFVQQDLPALNGVLSESMKWPAMPAVAMPVRQK